MNIHELLIYFWPPTETHGASSNVPNTGLFCESSDHEGNAADNDDDGDRDEEENEKGDDGGDKDIVTAFEMVAEEREANLYGISFGQNIFLS